MAGDSDDRFFDDLVHQVEIALQTVDLNGAELIDSEDYTEGNPPTKYQTPKHTQPKTPQQTILHTTHQRIETIPNTLQM